MPINIEIRRPELTSDVGGVAFDDCFVYDTIARPVLVLDLRNRELGVRDISGHITATVPSEAAMDLGDAPKNVSLTITTVQADVTTLAKPSADAE